MKKVVILLSAIGLFTTGLISCSSLTMETKRDFVDNTFYASNPSIAVKLADTFSMMEQKKENSFSFYSNAGLSGTSITAENYRFYDQMRMKQIVINIKKLNKGYWNANLNNGIPNPLEKGEIMQEGRKYYYSTFAVKTPEGDNLLMKRFARCSGGRSQTLIEYLYIQQIAPILGDYSKWQDPSALTNEQNSFLSQFNAEGEKDIRFMQFIESTALKPQKKKIKTDM